MAFDDFLNHRCSIYHAEKAASDLGFGITDDNDFSYQANPDKINEDVRCHFHIKSGMYQITQQESSNVSDVFFLLERIYGRMIRL